MPLAHARFDAAYDELRAVAASYLRRENAGHTLQPTALVHEAWFRLASRRPDDWNDEGHFYATAARAMRLVLVDHARARRRQKRGGGQRPGALPGEWARVGDPGTDDWLLALDDALDELARRDPRQAEIVEARFFGGRTVDEVAAAMHLSRATVERDWRVAKAWLAREIGEPGV